MHELPDRAVVDLKPALGQLCHQAAQGEGGRLSALDEPVPVLTRNLGRHVAADPARRDATGAPKPL